MPGRSDHAARKAAKRAGRERGCWVYIDSDALTASGLDPHGPTPFYRVWAGKRGRFIVTMYAER